MKRLLFILLPLFCCCHAWGQQVVSGRVVDAETGETLPYVSVYAGENNGTLSNEDGEFVLETDTDVNVRVSCIGYETLNLRATDIGSVIKLKHKVTALKELTVMPAETILDKVAKRLSTDYGGRKTKNGTFFCRILEEYQGKHELVEAVIRAKSNVAVRDMKVAYGRRLQLQNYETESSRLSNTNLHHMFELCPGAINIPFWSRVITPLYKKEYKKEYTTSCMVSWGEDGTKNYIIDFHQPKRLFGRKFLEGRLIVDATDYGIIQYSGSIPLMKIFVTGGEEVLSVTDLQGTFQINYKHEDGGTQVANIHYDIKGTDFTSKGILFSVDEQHIPNLKGTQVNENFVQAIKTNRNDKVASVLANIIKRTDVENKVAFSAHNLTYNRKNNTFVPDTSAIANTRHRDFISLVDSFAKGKPQEKVFIHMDNHAYQLGDTIWFSAYLRKTGYGIPSDMSRILYVELISEDGIVMDRHAVEMKNGRGHGQFVLNHPYMYAGFYEIRAYTSWQLNWGEFEHPHSSVVKEWFLTKQHEHTYYRDYEKLYSRVFPVYDKTNGCDTDEFSMTRRPLRRHYPQKKENNLLSVTFFPEGGNLIEGLPCRMAFECRFEDGRYANGILSIGNITAKTDNRGRGVISFVPGRKDKSMFTSDMGQKKEVTLPTPVQRGVSASIDEHRGMWKIAYHATGNLQDDSLGLTVTSEGRIEFYRPLLQKEGYIDISSDKLLTGVNELSIIDGNGQILYSRLFFVRKSAQTTSNISVVENKSEYAPFEKIDILIRSDSVRTSSMWQPISLAVRDRTSLNPSRENVMTEMLLSSEIKGYVPDPGYFFEKDDSIHGKHLDLLMMTQGWRRFKLQDMVDGNSWKGLHPIEKTQELQGHIYNLTDQSLGDSMPQNIHDKTVIATKYKKQKYVISEAYNVGGLDKVVLEPARVENGSFSLKLPRYYGSCALLMGIISENDMKNLRKHKWSSPDDSDTITFERKVELAENLVSVNFPYPRFVLPYDYYQTLHPKHIKDYDTNLYPDSEDSITTLREVPVSTRHGLSKFNDAFPLLVLDASEAENLVADAGIIGLGFEEGVGRALFGDLGLKYPYVHEMLPDGMTVTSSRILSRYGVNMLRRIQEGLGDVPLDSIYERKYLKSYHRSRSMSLGERREYNSLSKIDKFLVYTDYCPRQEGDRKYTGSDLPEINIVKYPYADGGERKIFADKYYVLPGLSQPIQFYSPDYSKQALPEGQGDYRRTLYWNPNLQLDENGEATVTFYNNSRTTHLSIEAEGQATDGTLLWGREE